MCLSPHVVHKGIQENKYGWDTPRQHDGIWSWKSRNSENNKIKTTLTKVGPKRAWEWAAQPPTWATRPITTLPRLMLCPRSGLSSIHSIFICFAFHFELNWKSLNKTTIKHEERLFQSWLKGRLTYNFSWKSCYYWKLITRDPMLLKLLWN